MKVVAIRIQSGSTSRAYRVSLVDDPFGIRQESFVSELSENEVIHESPWTPAAMRKEMLGNSGISKNFELIGQRLSSWLDASGLLTRWRNLLAAIDGAESLTLLDIEVPELAEAPWELMCDCQRVAQRFFLDPRRRAARYHPIDHDHASTASSWPLRLLVVLGVEMPDDPAEDAIGAQQEVEAIERELLPVGRSIDVELLELPTQAKLKEVVSDFQPHIFHFIGHGREDARSPGEAV